MPDRLNDDQFIQRRMLLAAVLSAVVMGAYMFLVPRPEAPPVPDTAPAPAAPAAGAEGERAGTPPTPAPSFAPPPEGGAIEAGSERTVTVETETFSVEFTNRGAAVRSWKLKEYKDARGEPLDLVHRQGAARHGNPFRLVLPGGDSILGADEALFSVNSGTPVRRAPETVVFEFAKDGLRIRKSFEFEAEGYLVRVETEVAEGGRPQRHLIAWGGGFGDTAQAGNSAFSQVFYHDAGEIERVAASDAEDEKVARSGYYLFAGLEDLFFAAAAIPEAGADLSIEAGAVEIEPANGEAGDLQTYAAAAFGGAPSNRLRFYVGPKSRDALSSVEGLGRALPRIVDFGFFAFIAEPLFLMLRWVYGSVVANWGWSIVVVTIIINTVLFPLKYKSTKSMRKMQQLQPLVKQINNRYKGVSMRDPRKAKQNEELQALYKKYKVNPMGGCLPILLQMPFFFAFYKLLTVAIEMRQAEWLWVSDLSNPETLAIRILPLAMVATQFWSQALTPTPTADAMQARMMKFMPLLFGFIFYQFQAGLVLYWLTSNCVGIGQQLLLNRLPQEQLQLDTGRPRGKRRKRRR